MVEGEGLTCMSTLTFILFYDSGDSLLIVILS